VSIQERTEGSDLYYNGPNVGPGRHQVILGPGTLLVVSPLLLSDYAVSKACDLTLIDIMHKQRALIFVLHN
jgi:hypothetical protein